MKKTFIIISSVLLLASAIFANNLSDITSVAAGAFPRGITAADVDGDGTKELVVANFGEDTLIGMVSDVDPVSSIMVYENTASGPVPTRFSAGKAPRGLAAGDINNDGREEFAFSNYEDGTVMISEGAEGMTTIAVGSHPVGLAIGDMDNNGVKKQDIAVAVYTDNKVVVLTRSSKGTYEKSEVAVPGSPTDVAIGTINNKRVIVSANYTAGNISIIEKGASGYVKKEDIRAGGGVCKVDIEDVTGDGSPDIIAANFYDNTISVIEYRNGAASEQVVYKLSGQRPNGMAVGDVNGDGKADVVTANRDDDTVDVLLQADGKLVLSKTYRVTEDEAATFGPVEAVIADLNADGLNDIAFTHMRTNTVKVIYQSLPASPVISSATHPDQTLWYTDVVPVIKFAADDLTGVDGYMYNLSKDTELYNPDKAVFTTADTVTLDALETGTWYITAVTKDMAGNISPKPSVFKVNITEALSEKSVYNYPNPASTDTTLRFAVAESADVKLVITDVNGTVVWHKELSASEVTAGVNYITWMLTNDTGRRVNNGVYIFKVITADRVVSKKIAVVK
ncbi:MAG: FG-GAP-like repeat-containing protein [Spirochaetia bacterium]|nr:FG-GAP-like repeat-containing protein [Spirochaetia bacterium]